VSRYVGRPNSWDLAIAVGESPDGSKLFVTGWTAGAADPYDYATLAYDTATGQELWLRRYNGPGNSLDYVRALSVSPDGFKLFVSGGSTGQGSDLDYTTIAYDAAAGVKLWLNRYNGPGNGRDEVRALAVSPEGATLFATGESVGSGSDADHTTVAYDAATGARLWVKRYNGAANSYDGGEALGLSPDGSKLFATGFSVEPGSGEDYTTIAYSTG
jgi:WD40 repeat protein